MSKQRTGMGRGLGAILSSSNGSSGTDLLQIPIDLISPNPDQPRKSFDPVKLNQLADSLRENGVVQPLIVRPVKGGQYQLIAGERRWRAAKAAELKQVPAVVRVEPDSTALEIALIENMVREDLTPVEEAQACAMLVEELDLTREQVGLKVGRSRVAVSNLIRLLELPDTVLEALSEGRLTEGHGRALLLVEDHELRKDLAQTAELESWSVRRLEEQARRLNDRSSGEQAANSQSLKAPSADELQALTEYQELFEKALGVDVRIAKGAKSSYRVQLGAASFRDLQVLVERVSGERVGKK